MLVGGSGGTLASSFITVRRVKWTELVELLTSPLRRSDLGGPEGELLVTGPPQEEPDTAVIAALVDAIGSLPIVVVLEADPDECGEAASAVDLVARDEDLDAVIDRFGRVPIAATSLVVLLRASERRPVAEGLAAESAVYSTLQSGPEFAAWRRGRPPRTKTMPSAPTVRVERHGDELVVTLDRPEARNALDARMRDELWDALLIAAADPGVAVRWRGAGVSFCAGGDLDEFGSRPDPGRAHLIRLTRSLGRLLHELAERTTVEVHGACAGSGIELPAFAGRVIAAPDTTMSLPELSLGLIPGAGGTVSLPRRIGRQRTAWLALTGATIDAATALEWGLVDELTSPH